MINLILGILSGSKFPYYLFFLTLSIYLYSYISISRASKEIYDFFWINSDKATVGDKLKLRYKVLYYGLNPIPYSEITCKISKRLGDISLPVETAFIKPLGTIYLSKEVTCRHRGFYKLGELSVKICDAFNIFTKEVFFNTKIDLLVYPRVHEVTYFKLPATEMFGNYTVKNSINEDYTSISTIREYRDGDNYKMIHWKSSAKLDNIYVRKNELSGSIKSYIFLDGYCNNFGDDIGEDVEELTVETTASLINYFLRNDLDTTLITNTKERNYFNGRDISRFEMFLKELIRFIPDGEIKFDEFINIESRKLTYNSTIIVITTKLDEKLFSTLIKLKEKRFYPILILASNDETYEDEEDKRIFYLRNNGIDLYTINPYTNIKDVLEGGI